VCGEGRERQRSERRVDGAARNGGHDVSCPNELRRAGATIVGCWRGMCYKSRAVNSVAKQELAPVQRESAEVSTQEATPAKVEGTVGVVGEDPSRYCPVCSQRLESRRCKLICPVCGYYMSCADYY
jgi:hypothetical protein